MSKVTSFDGLTYTDLDPDLVLTEALGKMDEVVIVGFTKDGKQYFGTSVADGGNALWHLERAKWALMKKVDDLENGDY